MTMLPGDETKFGGLVARNFPGCKLIRAWELSGGMSARSIALEIAHPDGQTQRVLVRQQPGDPVILQNQFRLLGILARHGLPVPAPLRLDPADACLLLEYREGSLSFAPETDVLQMADLLARIHALPLDELSFLPAPDDHCGQAAKLEDDWGIRDLLKAKTTPHGVRTLLHGDFWAGNILWLNGKLEAVIDWEDAALGDPLIDLAIARLDIGYMFGGAAMEAFTERYQQRSGRGLAGLPYQDIIAALRLLCLSGGDFDAWAGFFHPYGRTDISGDNIREFFGRFVQQAKNLSTN